jgi:hypothetical protein
MQRLKLDLLTDGISVMPSARKELSGADGTRPLTMADYASTSGIALQLEGDIWVNAPFRDFNPNFVGDSPHRLDFERGAFRVRSNGLDITATPIPVPAYATGATPSGRPYVDCGMTHTDRVRISPIAGCIGGCRFCDLTVKHAYRTKPLEDLLQTVAVALRDPVLPARHILISGGAPRREDYDYLNGVYRAVTAAFPNTPVDIMMTPLPGLLDLRALRDAGIHALSINLELFDETAARELMPVKGALTRQYWLDFIADAVRVFGPGRVRSLLMLGLEPLEGTLAGVESLARIGCDPVLSPFRPDPATPLGARTPPTSALLAEACERATEIVAAHGVKLGPRCIPCQHNTVTFPDGSGDYMRY